MLSKDCAVPVTPRFARNFNISLKQQVRAWCASYACEVPRAMEAKVRRARKGEYVEFIFEKSDTALAFKLTFA